MKKIYVTLGASNHTTKERQTEDFYATDPKAMELFLELNKEYNLGFNIETPIWECASGENHLANVLRANGYSVRTSDIVQRLSTTELFDFLSEDNTQWNGDIITNPPFKYAQNFVEKSMDILEDGKHLALFLKVQFLEGRSRKKMFEKYPPKYIFVSSSRLLCAKNADFAGMIAGGGSAVAYAWYVWEKGYNGDTILKWFN